MHSLLAKWLIVKKSEVADVSGRPELFQATANLTMLSVSWASVDSTFHPSRNMNNKPKVKFGPLLICIDVKRYGSIAFEV